MKLVSLVIPIVFLLVTIFALFKKLKIYDSFAKGAAKGLPTVYSVFPYLVAIFVMTELFSQSGISDKFIALISPVFSFLKIPSEIAPLVVLKPFSGGGSLAMLSDIYEKYGVDSFISLCASTVYGSSETIYIAFVNFDFNCFRLLYLQIVLLVSDVEMFDHLLALHGFAVAVFYENHSDKRKSNRYRGVIEQGSHTSREFHYPAR